MPSHKIYRLLLSNNLGRGNRAPTEISQDLDKMTLLQITDLCHTIATSLPKSKDYPHTPFSFIGNFSLAGGPYPCSSPKCRIEIVDDLTRFASLYADQVSIPNPFQWLGSCLEYFSKQRAVDEMAIYISILWKIKPLIDQKIIYFVEHESLHVCSTCYPSALSNSIPNSSLNPLSIQTYLHSKLLKEVTYNVSRSKNRLRVEITGPDHLTPHGRAYYYTDNLGTLNLDLFGINPIKLSKRQILQSGILHLESAEIMYDLQRQDSYARRQNLSYLTQRPIDFELLQLDNNGKIEKSRPATSPTPFAHMLPIIDQVPVATILKLRSAEEPAFNLYRDAVAKSIKESEKLPNNDQRAIFNDVIRPEINNIQLSIQKSKVSAHLPRLTACSPQSRKAVDVTTTGTIQASGDRAS